MSLPIIEIPGFISLIIDIALSLVVLGLVLYMSIKNKLSLKIIISYGVAVLLIGISSIVVDLPIFRWSCIIVCFLFSIYLALFLTDKEKVSTLKHNKKASKKDSALTVNETDELIKNLDNAIEALSATQTGALITIVRNDDLTEFTDKSGTEVNAPVTPEILETIFYKGTPLHDGATIISGNMIKSAAVFYQPTQRPLNGKYGSRHRAAIGISEVCDAITIVVSEETGKVSIAYKGELTPIPVNNFAKKFKEYYYNE